MTGMLKGVYLLQSSSVLSKQTYSHAALISIPVAPERKFSTVHIVLGFPPGGDPMSQPLPAQRSMTAGPSHTEA